ncbi:MAG: hypothetical protein RL189_410 [Pseudomonadota bacterium]|jgi:hypothetical protein
MAALTSASLPPAEHSIKVEIVSKLDEVKIDELELGDEYPALYRVLELFPSLAGNAIKQRLSLESQMTCKAKRNAVSGMLGVQFNDCRLTHNKSGALWSAATKRLVELCSTDADPSRSNSNVCHFLFSPAAGRTPAAASIRSIPQAQCQWQGDNRLSKTNTAEADAAKDRSLAERRRENLSNHLSTRPFYILERVDELRFAKLFQSESLQKNGGHTNEDFRAGRLWSEFLFGGALPTHGSDGSAYKIKVILLSQPQIRGAGLGEVLCAGREGRASIDFSNVALRIDFSKNKFRLKGDFTFSQKLSVTGLPDFSQTQTARTKLNDRN